MPHKITTASTQNLSKPQLLKEQPMTNREKKADACVTAKRKKAIYRPVSTRRESLNLRCFTAGIGLPFRSENNLGLRPAATPILFRRYT
jgi:hypothetical protein